MPNSIIRKNLNIKNNLIVTGTIYIVESEEGLKKLENIDTFLDISGEYDDLEINGDLAVCEYCCSVSIAGEVRSIGNMVLK